MGFSPSSTRLRSGLDRPEPAEANHCLVVPQPIGSGGAGQRLLGEAGSARKARLCCCERSGSEFNLAPNALPVPAIPEIGRSEAVTNTAVDAL